MKIIVSIFIVATLAGCYSRIPDKTGFEGKSLPDFDILLSDSVTHLSTSSISIDKSFVVVYFGTQCPYSKAEIEEITEHNNELKDIKFYLITSDPFPEMKKIYERYQLHKYPNLTIGIDEKDFFGIYYKITGVPFNAFYGSNRRLETVYKGNISSKIIRHETNE